jgi:hypothetical protein
MFADEINTKYCGVCCSKFTVMVHPEEKEDFLTIEYCPFCGEEIELVGFDDEDEVDPEDPYG